MKKIENASGIMMNRNIPVLRFNLENGFLTSFEIINRSMLPIDFELNSNDKQAFLVFLQERVVDPTRIQINSDVKKIGMKYYDPDKLFHFMHGRSIQDSYWFKFDDDSDDLSYETLIQSLDNAIK